MELSYSEIKTEYAQKLCWGMSCAVDVKGCDAELIRSESAIQNYVVQLCDLIQMKRYKDTTIVHFGDSDIVAGYSMTQLIETSLISGHFANHDNSAYIDIFSCKPYSPKTVAEFTKEFFKGKDYNLQINFRK